MKATTIDTTTDPVQRVRERWKANLLEFVGTPDPAYPLRISRKELVRRMATHGVPITEQAVSLWLNAKATPRPHVQAAIAKSLQTTVSTLFPADVAA